MYADELLQWLDARTAGLVYASVARARLEMGSAVSLADGHSALVVLAEIVESVSATMDDDEWLLFWSTVLAAENADLGPVYMQRLWHEYGHTCPVWARWLAVDSRGVLAWFEREPRAQDDAFVARPVHGSWVEVEGSKVDRSLGCVYSVGRIPGWRSMLLDVTALVADPQEAPIE